jgi:hypothetical protein
MANYWDMDGNEIQVDEWSRLFEDENRFVATTEIAEKAVGVSTVWIGLSWMLEVDEGRKPLIYETMAFADDSYDDLGCWRWESREDALAGHKRIVRGILDGSVDLSS